MTQDDFNKLAMQGTFTIAAAFIGQDDFILNPEDLAQKAMQYAAEIVNVCYQEFGIPSDTNYPQPPVSPPVQPPPVGVTLPTNLPHGAKLHPQADGTIHWKLTGFERLSADENSGRHNVYVNAFDENGRRELAPTLRIGYTWEGKQPEEEAPLTPLDKPPGEDHGNIVMYPGQVVSVWLTGDGILSDVVSGMHTMHQGEELKADGDPGNYPGHWSYRLNFQRTGAAPQAKG